LAVVVSREVSGAVGAEVPSSREREAAPLVIAIASEKIVTAAKTAVATNALTRLREMCRSLRIGRRRAALRVLKGAASGIGACCGGCRRARREGVNIDLIATSPIKISCVLERDQVARAAQVLRAEFKLSGEGTASEKQSFKAAESL